ncbi:MAG: nickel pincer cofactor biosynthesis protein LarC [Lachnospiraceae bacterium]|nr:nickel pincer cofactor biosynthesis protein LarC [Lachnospiraceae bacterium]
MGKSIYLECETGISGDMCVAALLDLGANKDVLEKVLKSLPLDGYKTSISRVKKSGLDCLDFDVILDEKYENHDHDMEYLYGHELNHDHQHGHNHDGHSHEHAHDEHNHDNEHNHEHVHDEHSHDHNHEHSHVHRHLSDVIDIINAGDMTENARKLAIKAFTILGEAEAKAHGTTIEEVHFHEVGAVDSIVDVIAAAVCLDSLGIEDVIIPVIKEGSGSVRCAHGILPVPVPAVSNIVAANGLMLGITDMKGELVTPTGAALAATFKTSDRLPGRFSVEKIGLGAGKRAYERPSIVRAMIINSAESDTEDEIWKLESNIDDSTGEALGYCMEKLLAAGARDVHYFPVFMKKNRPAYQLNVLCKEKDIEKLSEIIFKETTTIGIRRLKMDRTILKRYMDEALTKWGKVKVKVCDNDFVHRVYPEYDSVKEICDKTGAGFQEVYNAAVKG